MVEQPKSREHCGVRYPAEWFLEESGGPSPFYSRAVYRLPDGSRYVWEARRHRKGAGPKAPSGQAAQTGDADEKNRLGGFRWFLWAPHRITWWVGVVFGIGAALFVLAATATLAPSYFGGKDSAELLSSLSEWIGALLFTLATYLWWLEGINASDYIGTTPGLRLVDRFQWLGWQPRQLGFVAPLLFLVGSLAWNIQTSLALAETLGWSDKMSTGMALTGIVGAFLFLLPSYLQVIEVCHRFFCWQVNKVSWWVTILFLIGSAAYVVGAVVGFPGLGLSKEMTVLLSGLGYLNGSVLFFVGSYLMLLELVAE